MDDIEIAILDAWHRIGPGILADPKELRRRLARRISRSLSRPPRAWCLALRASDRRFAEFRAQQAGDGCQQICIDASLLRALCGAVSIPEGADRWDCVAKLTGRGFRGLHTARVSGRLRAHSVPLLGGRRGNPVPILECRDALDPNWPGLEGADRAWGWTARYLVNGLPEDFLATLERVPVWRGYASRDQYQEDVHPEVSGAPSRRASNDRLPPPPRDYVWYKWSKNGEYLGDDPKHWRKRPEDPGTPPPLQASVKRKRKRRPRVLGGSLHFRGWMWICPKCGKRVRVLYLPARRASLIEERHEGTEARRREGVGEEGSVEGGPRSLRASVPARPRAFPILACYSCHRVRGFSRVDKNSWNELIGYLSGGLLYGREVSKPAWYADEGRRKVAYRPRLGSPAPRRQQVLRRMMNGWTITQIAGDLKMCKQQVCDCIRKLCRQEGIANRRELATKLGSPHFQPMDSDRIRREPARDQAGRSASLPR